MKNGIFAIYKGNEYEVGIKEDGSITLRSFDNNDKTKDFSLYKGVVYIKNVIRSDVDELYSISTYAEYKNIKLQVIKEDGEKILLSGMMGDYRVFEKLDMQIVDKGIYHKWVNKNDVSSIYEIKKPI